MKVVSISEAKAQLSKLLKTVQSGEPVAIGPRGRPIALLIAFDADQAPRQLGGWEGRVTMTEDFNELRDDVLVGFEGGTA